MDTNRTRGQLVREAAGLTLMIVSGGLAVTFLISVAGIGVTVVTAALLGLAGLGRWLASGTAPEAEGDYRPLGPGPLYQDPEDPQSFIPRI